MKFFKITLVFLLLQTLNSIGQEVKIIVDKLDYNITDKIKVTYKSESNIDNIGELDQSQFKLIEGPSTTVSQMYKNGESKYEKTYSFILEPRRAGKIDLPQLEMYLDGKILKPEKLFLNIAGTLLTDKEVTAKKKPEDSYKEYTARNVFKISAPAYLERVNVSSRDAVICFRNTAKDIMAFVILVKKEDITLSGRKLSSLLTFHNDIVNGYAKDLKKKTVSAVKSSKENDINFTETNLTYVDTETNENYYYFIGSAETKTVLYSLIIKTLAKNKDQLKTDFQKILYSIKD